MGRSPFLFDEQGGKIVIESIGQETEGEKVPSQTFSFDPERSFTHHPPKGDQIERYKVIRNKAKEMGNLLIATCPVSRELFESIKSLEECVMWANAAIARNE